MKTWLVFSVALGNSNKESLVHLTMWTSVCMCTGPLSDLRLCVYDHCQPHVCVCCISLTFGQRDTLCSRVNFPLEVEPVPEPVLRLTPVKGATIKPIAVQVMSPPPICNSPFSLLAGNKCWKFPVEFTENPMSSLCESQIHIHCYIFSLLRVKVLVPP